MSGAGADPHPRWQGGGLRKAVTQVGGLPRQSARMVAEGVTRPLVTTGQNGRGSRNRRADVGLRESRG